MALTVGDNKSILSRGVGHSGGTTPSFTELMTRGHWDGSATVLGQLTHYAVQLDISDLTTDTDASQGLYSGIFRWVTDRPQYDGVTVVPTGENEGNVWKEGILIGRNQLSPIDRIININRSGDYGSLSGVNFAIDNTSDFGADPAGFDDYLLTNGYEIINRPIKFYVIIDDVFYQIWGGIVSKTRYNEKVFEFICKDIFEEAHKPMPPNEITRKNFPFADGESVGKTIPILFGDVLRAEAFNVKGTSDPISLGIDPKTNDIVEVTAANEYDIDSNVPYLDINTIGESFPEDFFATGAYYLIGFKGTTESVRILGNDETSSDVTRIFLGKKLSVTIATFNFDHAYNSNGPISNDVWYFKIFQFDISYLVSNDTISEYVLDSLNKFDFVQYNKDKLEYDPIDELLQETDATITGLIPYPNIKIINNQLNIEGDYIRDTSIYPDAITLSQDPIFQTAGNNPFPTHTFDGDTDFLLDKQRNTYLGNNIGNNYASLELLYDVIFPENIVVDDLDEMFLLFDFSIELSGGLTTCNFTWELIGVDPITGLQFEDKTDSSYPANFTASPTPYYFDFIPDEYYFGGFRDSRDSIFQNSISGTFLSDLFKIDSNVVDSFRKAAVSRNFKLKIKVEALDGSGDLINGIDRIRLYQIGFFGNKKLNTIKERNFIKTKGELVSSNETNNVYRAIQHIFESYDGINSSEIDYGNLGSRSTRSNWRVGRQVTQKRLSSRYLKEIAAQSFVGIYPDRRGKRHTKSFLDDVVNVWTHADDNGTIIKGSIKKFEATPINELFNEFTINYDWNPGLKQFNKTIFVRNVNAVGEVDPLNASFPSEDESVQVDNNRSFTSVLTREYNIRQFTTRWQANIFMADTSWAVVGQTVSFSGGDENTNFEYGEIVKIYDSSRIIVYFQNTKGAEDNVTSTSGTLTSHGSNIQKWKSWVGGINDYNTAKNYWEICYNSWLKTKTVNKLPRELGDCYWFIEGAEFDGTGEISDNSAAHRFLAELISWSTRQKFRAHYSIPVTTQNIQADLLSVLKFKDQKYTNGDFLTGYFEKIKLNPTDDSIDIEAILRPLDMETFPIDGDLIIESGDAPDTITEFGNAPNTITETGV